MTLLHVRPPVDVSYKPYKCTVQQSDYFWHFKDRVLLKQGGDGCSFTWGISKEVVHETTVGKERRT